MADELDALLRDLECCVVGADGIGNEAERAVLAAVLRRWGSDSEAIVLCEPSLARNTTQPPDVVLIHRGLGVHVMEVKGHPLGAIESIVGGGEFRVSVRGRIRAMNPVNQARKAMFDIKHAVELASDDEPRIPFLYWIVLPNIARSAWRARWGEGAFEPNELIFADDLDAGALERRFSGAARRLLNKWRIDGVGASDLTLVLRAFGDSAVLTPHDRKRVPTLEGTLGERFEELSFEDKRLSGRQQQLADTDWRGGPRLVRGVAGSGKTVLLATKMAKLAERWSRKQLSLLDGARPNRALAVCFNRALVPFIKAKVAQAFKQRTGRDAVPEGLIEVHHFNGLMYELSKAGLWDYQRVGEDDGDVEERARRYLAKLLERHTPREGADLDALKYDVIWVDEGQDFVADEYRILVQLCRTDDKGHEPNLFVFYDDAQNVYGRARPTWADVGLTLVGGRSEVMTECFRNTRQIVEPSFNVLLGAAASDPRVGTSTFADTEYLVQKGEVSRESGFWRVAFAKRQGDWPQVTVASSPTDEIERVIARVKWLVLQEKVRPEDILVLGPTRERLSEIARAAGRAPDWPWSLALPFKPDEKDKFIFREGHVTLSTVQSAKGYDAFCVILVSANEFSLDVKGRAMFYVACTRAREHLDVFGYSDTGLVTEMSRVLEHLKQESHLSPS